MPNERVVVDHRGISPFLPNLVLLLHARQVCVRIHVRGEHETRPTKRVPKVGYRYANWERANLFGAFRNRERTRWLRLKFDGDGVKFLRLALSTRHDVTNSA